MNELKTRNTFSVATQSFTRLGDHQFPSFIYEQGINYNAAEQRDMSPYF